MTLAIKVDGLTKHYGHVQAVKGISFSVQKGALFAFLGTNGAGKSTTIEMLCTLLDISSGEVIINGYTLGTSKGNQAIRQTIGIVFQQSLLDTELTVIENIMHRGKFYNLTKQQLKENYSFVCTYLHLDDISHKKYGQLSGGQKRRADIARAIIHKPQILFLDEPTTGLDPQTRKFVWQAIEKLRVDMNMTIFLTTHYMEEGAVADKIVVLKEGEIVAEGSPNELKLQYASDQLLMTFKDDEQACEMAKSFGYAIEPHGDMYKLGLQSTVAAIPILNTLAPYLTSFEVIKGSLDQVFIQINEEQREKS
ncbi:MAG: ATP-binding cassette domain-containing protein [Solibacillus sp.]